MAIKSRALRGLQPYVNRTKPEPRRYSIKTKTHLHPVITCRMKLYHQDYWQAMQHAASLPPEDRRINVYPCEYCGGIHVGHGGPPPQNKRQVGLTELEKKIAETKLRIEKLTYAISRFRNPRPATIKKYNSKLRDLNEHLARLERSSPWQYEVAQLSKKIRRGERDLAWCVRKLEQLSNPDSYRARYFTAMILVIKHSLARRHQRMAGAQANIASQESARQ